MGSYSSGALNASGFNHAVQQNKLPNFNHITHSGIFNENYFSIGPKTKDVLCLYHGLAISNCYLDDFPNRNYFLSCFLKSSRDGEKRICPLNVVVALDVSGSMGQSLSPGSNESRLNLARRAIMMLYRKLEPTDVFSFITFHLQAKTLIPSQYVGEMDIKTVDQIVNSQFQSGGTQIRAGFDEAIKNIESFRVGKQLNHYQHRIVLLTDVNDNSVQNENILIDKISSTGINTTIIGVSTDFRSQTCEKLIEVKGFNYLSAIDDSDLQTYLVDQFDYTFFPCAQNIEINIISDCIEKISVYGSPDWKTMYEKIGNKFTVSKIKSAFPSDLQRKKNGDVETRGGLILVKIQPKASHDLPDLNVSVELNYKDLAGQPYNNLYKIERKVEAEEYYSDSAIQKGVRLFYYTETIRNLLQQMADSHSKLSDINREMYLSKLDKLAEYCPETKKEQLMKIKEIVAHQ